MGLRKKHQKTPDSYLAFFTLKKVNQILFLYVFSSNATPLNDTSRYNYFFFFSFLLLVKNSSGKGNTMVEFFSIAISAKVWYKRSLIDEGD